MYSATILLITLITLCSSYTLKQGVEIVFPVQTEVCDNEYSFLRVDSHNETTILNCPAGFYFDSDELKCKYSAETPSSEEITVGVCPMNNAGLISYSMNCRKFINCYDGRGTVQNCAGYLLYNKVRECCDYPEKSNCCEYRENQFAK